MEEIKEVIARVCCYCDCGQFGCTRVLENKTESFICLCDCPHKENCKKATHGKSHGVCPKCGTKLMKELEEFKKVF